jgi:hypothetical protein
MAFDLNIAVTMVPQTNIVTCGHIEWDGPIGGQNAIFGGIEE